MRPNDRTARIVKRGTQARTSPARTPYVAAGVLAVVAVLTRVGTLRSPPTNLPDATVPVVVASRDIPAGVVIDRASLVFARWPAGTVPAGVYAARDSVANRVTRLPIRKGESFNADRLAPPGAVNAFEVKAAVGKRQFSIRVDAASSLAGLAIGTVAQRGVDGRVTDAAVATLEVAPEEAERLAIATTEGEIRLVVRGYDNSETGESLTSQAAPQRGCAPSPGQALVRDLLNRHCSGAVRFLPDLPVERPELRRSRP